MKKYIKVNQEVYDSLAGEYEQNLQNTFFLIKKLLPHLSII
jgi:hypothetical protein